MPTGSPPVGETLRSARVHDRTGTLVLGMRHPGGEFRTNPPLTSEIAGGETLIAIGDAEQARVLTGESTEAAAPLGR